MSQVLLNSKELLISLFLVIALFSVGTYIFTGFMHKVGEKRAEKKLQRLLERRDRYRHEINSTIQHERK